MNKVLKYKVSTTGEKKIKIKIEDLIKTSIEELVKKKNKDAEVIEVNGNNVTISDNKVHEILIDPKDLINNSAEQIIKNKLKLNRTKKQIKIEYVGCSGK